jgi:guanosine-3',5'-bis(diphosphate) 3'-pyrophosphohydrolase
MLPGDNVGRLLDAVAFASRAHRHQLRKDNQTPYVSHVLRVALIVRHVFDIADEQVLTAALLHDTVEDTTTDFDDLQEHFGAEIAGWVALLSKDKRLPEPEREAAYQDGLAKAPWQVKVCKLADIYDNLTDSAHLDSEQRAKTLKRTLAYQASLKSSELPDQVQRAWDLVKELRSCLEAGKRE